MYFEKKKGNSMGRSVPPWGRWVVGGLIDAGRAELVGQPHDRLEDAARDVAIFLRRFVDILALIESSTERPGASTEGRIDSPLGDIGSVPLRLAQLWVNQPAARYSVLEGAGLLSPLAPLSYIVSPS